LAIFNQQKMNQPISANQQIIPTVVVSRPGIMRQSLQTSLAVHPGIVVVAVCGDGLTSLSQLAQKQPRLLIIDSNLLDEEVEALIGTVKIRWPAIHCLVLLQSRHRERATLAAGADAVIQRDKWGHHSSAMLLQFTQKPTDFDPKSTA